jgi:hypothetical protein
MHDRKYRIIAEDYNQILLQEISDLKKLVKGCTENGMEARAFFKTAEGKI